MKTFLFLVCSVLLSTHAFAHNDELRFAVENNDLGKVKKIIESGQGSKDELVEAEPYGPGVPIITLAARSGCVEVARYLISLKADLNARTPLGETALVLASYYDDALYGGSGNYSKNDQVARDLIDAGAELENPGFYSAISYAAYKGRNEIISYLLSKGAKPDSDAQDGKIITNTGLIFAARNGHLSTALLLMDHNADPRIVNSKDHDAMYFAVNYKQTHIVPYIQCALDLKPGQKFKDVCH